MALPKQPLCYGHGQVMFACISFRSADIAIMHLLTLTGDTNPAIKAWVSPHRKNDGGQLDGFRPGAEDDGYFLAHDQLSVANRNPDANARHGDIAMGVRGQWLIVSG